MPTSGTTGQILAKMTDNNHDTQWVSASAGQYTIGQSVLGGVVFFVYVDSTGTQHGLVAAEADEPGGPNYTGGLSTTSGTAQYQCANKTTNGFTDWILPNQSQITILYNNRFAIDPTDPNGNGGFSNEEQFNGDTTASIYWSSTTTNSACSAWSQYFGNGTQNPQLANTLLSVRCIRTF